MLARFESALVALFVVVSLPLTPLNSVAQTESGAQMSRERVERIVTILASDEMEGRGTFSEGIERAAAFIEKEFGEIGLDTLDGLSSYRQAFELFQLQIESQSIILNGAGIQTEKAFFLAYSPEISWMTRRDVLVVHVASADEFRRAFQSAHSGQQETLYLVDPSLQRQFSAYRKFAANGTHTLELGRKKNSAFVLTNVAVLESFAVSAHFRVEQLGLANVTGTIPGHRRDEIVLFAAHYDHIGITTPVDGDSVANGANDNASGTTAVLELARYFKTLGTPERSLIFAAFTAEEIGGYGSEYLSTQLDPDQVVAMFNIEMIGKPAESGPNTAWITGFDRSDFGQILQAAVKGTPYEFYADPYPDQNLFYRSDNATLARLGVPAHSISTTPVEADQDYHRISDEVETLDLDHLTNTIAAIAAGARTIASGEATPKRVDKTLLE